MQTEFVNVKIVRDVESEVQHNLVQFEINSGIVVHSNVVYIMEISGNDDIQPVSPDLILKCTDVKTRTMEWHTEIDMFEYFLFRGRL